MYCRICLWREPPAEPAPCTCCALPCTPIFTHAPICDYPCPALAALWELLAQPDLPPACALAAAAAATPEMWALLAGVCALCTLKLHLLKNYRGICVHARTAVFIVEFLCIGCSGRGRG